jgi:hypothetical protein
MGWGVLMHFMAPALQRPSHPIGEILLPLGFCLVVVLFPFQWSGETRDGLWKE